MVVLASLKPAGNHHTGGKVRGGTWQARWYPHHRRIANKCLNPTKNRAASSGLYFKAVPARFLVGLGQR
jgi:hypothetical protein